MLVEKIAVHRIDLPKSNPPLRTFCKKGIEELAESIRIIGLVQPMRAASPPGRFGGTTWWSAVGTGIRPSPSI